MDLVPDRGFLVCSGDADTGRPFRAGVSHEHARE